MMTGSAVRRRRHVGGGALAALCATVLAAFVSAAPAPFEDPPAQPPAAVLSPAMVAGKDYAVIDPVTSDGLMHRYVLDTRFGRFDAYGPTALAMRIREAQALSDIDRTSKIEVVAGGVGQGVVSQVETVTSVATHPVGFVTGIPKGIAHLFDGYSAQAKEAVAEAKQVTAQAGETDGAPGSTGDKVGKVADKGSAAAKSYADGYFGISAAERRWYKKYGVDPYTDNAPLRDAIHRNANVEAAAGFGTRFVGLPHIPGIDTVRKAQEAIYNEDPATVRVRTRAVLEGYGLSASEIERFQKSAVLTPTRQVLLLGAAASLDGVAGRAELFRHALGLTSNLEAQVYLQSAGVLVLAHRAQPVAAVLAGVRLPAAAREDGSIVVCGAFDAIYWTETVASGEAQLREAVAASAAPTRELWLAGSVSERARRELTERGWLIHDGVGAPLPDPAGR